MWLLNEEAREVAQVVFLLHPEWQSFVEGVEVGTFTLRFPPTQLDHTPLVFACRPDGVEVVWEGWWQRFALDDAREAMRTVEAILDDRLLCVDGGLFTADAALPPVAEGSARTIVSWSGRLDRVDRGR